MFLDSESMQLFINLRQALADDLHTQIGTAAYRKGLTQFALNDMKQSGRNDLCHYAFDELFNMAVKQPIQGALPAEACATMAIQYAAQHVDENKWPTLIEPAEEYLRQMTAAGLHPPKEFYKLLTLICNNSLMASLSANDVVKAAISEKVYRYACLGASSVDEFEGTMAYGGIMLASMTLGETKGQQYMNALQQQIINEGGAIIA